MAPVSREGNGRSGARWLLAGFVLAALTFFGIALWLAMPSAGVTQAAPPPALTIEIRGYRWWWDVRYPSADPNRIAVTANELHIPLGQTVEVTLRSDNVIHSFWVPALGGKTDLIPGQINRMRIEADRAGVYRGQCAEFCGLQHAGMAFLVVVEPPREFEAWLTAQIAPATQAASDTARRGQTLFQVRCGGCHAVRGTDAMGIVGPDLTHLKSRRTIAAGLLPNTPGHLAGWIANPQTLKPGSLMPNLELSGAELTSIAAYLETLQ